MCDYEYLQPAIEFYEEMMQITEPNQPDPLEEARAWRDSYQHRINQDDFYGDLASRLRYEDTAYKLSMMNAAIAQAEAQERTSKAQERTAAALESIIEATADFVDKTSLVDALCNWKIRQR